MDYGHKGLDEADLAGSPIEQLRAWLDEAASRGVREPEAMHLSTADAEGRPSGRIVLLRGLDERGLTFFTNFQSRKAEDLSVNPSAAATFYWSDLERQVRVEGSVTKVAESESDAYFMSRPLASRISTMASPQSRPIASRAELEQMVRDVADRAGPFPARPATWGGYRISPDRVEFWQGRAARLHDRLVYEREGDGWRIVRLAP